MRHFSRRTDEVLHAHLVRHNRRRRLMLAGALVALAAAALGMATSAVDGRARWTQWGGPARDFVVEGVHLDDRWDQRSPRLLWERQLGNGHSAIVSDGERLFTLYGENDREAVVALEPASGETVWSYDYPVGYASHMAAYDGPHATPLIVGDMVFTVGIDAQVHALDGRMGKPLWRRDLVAELGVTLPQSGYGASPLAWRDLIIFPGLGGDGPGAVALRMSDGVTVWRRHDFRSSHASPIVFSHAGRDQVVFHGMDWIYALDPEDGELIWRHRVRRNAADNVSFTSVWDPEGARLYVSHGYDSYGLQALELRAESDSVAIEEVWNNARVRVTHGNAVRIGERLYTSPSDAFVSAVDLVSGEQLWKERLPKANFLAVGEELLVLDEDGVLYVARPDSEGLGIRGQLAVLDYNAWTVPTLIGNRLYARDRFKIVALELPTR